MNESGPLRGNRGKCPTIRAFFLLLFFSFSNSACMDEREIYLFIYLFISLWEINEVLCDRSRDENSRVTFGGVVLVDAKDSFRFLGKF